MNLEARWYFALIFGWSWTWWGLAAISGREWTETPILLLYVLGGIGPLLAAAVMVYLGDAEDARAFWYRVIDFRRIPPIWYVAILAIAFIPNLLARLAPAGSAVAENAERTMLASVLLVSVLAGLAEEPGWRGYALDRLVMTRTALTASLVVGVAWTIWHLPFYAITGTIQHEAGMWSRDFWFDMSNRLPLAVLFAWVYLSTNRGILAVVLLHAVDNVASVLISPEGDQLIVRLVVVTTFAVMVVSYFGARTLTRHSGAHLRPRTARKTP